MEIRLETDSLIYGLSNSPTSRYIKGSVHLHAIL
jgi:hypothetical protein